MTSSRDTSAMAESVAIACLAHRLQREREAERDGRVCRTAADIQAQAKAKAEARAALIQQRALARKAQSEARKSTEVERRNAAFRERYARNLGHERARVVAYKARHSDRKALWEADRSELIRSTSDGTLSAVVIARLKRSTEGCAYCGKAMDDAEKQTDHIVPLCAGGRHVIENIVICCAGCNGHKARLLPSEWAGRMEAVQNC